VKKEKKDEEWQKKGFRSSTVTVNREDEEECVVKNWRQDSPLQHVEN
jgi:hypothetical protein